MSFLCKMRGVIDGCKSGLFGHLPPQPRALTSWKLFFFTLPFLVGHRVSLASWNQMSCRERQHLSRKKFLRVAFKGRLPLTGVVRNCPLSGIIFWTWFVQDKLCWGSNGKSVCLCDLRNSLFDFWVPEQPVEQGLNVTFSYKVSIWVLSELSSQTNHSV